MNENEVLEKLLASQIEEYEFLGKKFALMDDKDVDKAAKLSNSRNRLSKAITGTIALMRDPKLQLVSDRGKKDLAKFAQRIIDESKEIEKTPLKTTRNYRGRIRGKKRSLIVQKKFR